MRQPTKAFLTPRDLAEALGASESSLKRWADQGLVRVTRTAGGHRRIALGDAIRFIRASRLEVDRPDLLGFDDVGGARPGAGAGAADALFGAFLRDDPRAGRSLIVSAYFAGESIAALCDGAIREALHRVGLLWREGDEGILLEHRAVDTCLQALDVLRSAIGPAPADAPVALGGAAANDPYLLPSVMAATVLADVGYRDVNLGPVTPTHVLRKALERYAPALVWRSFSVDVEVGALRRDLAALAEPLAETGGRVVCGGRGVPGGTLALPPHVHHLAGMSELAGFARGLLAARRTPRSRERAGRRRRR